MRQADILPRGFAAVLDLGLASGIAFGLASATDAFMQAFFGPGFQGRFDPANLVLGGAFVAYFVLGEISPLRGSIGKALLGLEVCTVGGSATGISRSVIRSVFKFAGLGALGVGVLVILFNQRRLALHDLLSGTEVMHTDLP